MEKTSENQHVDNQITPDLKYVPPALVEFETEIVDGNGCVDGSQIAN